MPVRPRQNTVDPSRVLSADGAGLDPDFRGLEGSSRLRDLGL